MGEGIPRRPSEIWYARSLVGLEKFRLVLALFELLIVIGVDSCLKPPLPESAWADLVYDVEWLLIQMQ